MRYLVYRSYASDAQSMDQYGLVVNYALHGLQVYMIKYSFDIASIYTCVRGKRRFDSFFFFYFHYWETVMCSTFSYTAIDKEKEN